MGHGHHHAAAHFSWCGIDRQDRCYCEPIRYFLSAGWGFLFASVQWYLATRIAGSHGAEGDASHAFADSSFILISAFLALFKHADREHAGNFDVAGIWVNSLFLMGAALYIAYALVFGKGFSLFSSEFMLVAGLVGLVGNAFQVIVLGETHDHQVSMHSTTKQHIMYDMLYSAVVMGAAVLAMAAEWLLEGQASAVTRTIDVLVAVFLSGAMFLGGSKNLRDLYGRGHHRHHHH